MQTPTLICRPRDKVEDPPPRDLRGGLRYLLCVCVCVASAVSHGETSSRARRRLCGDSAAAAIISSIANSTMKTSSAFLLLTLGGASAFAPQQSARGGSAVARQATAAEIEAMPGVSTECGGKVVSSFILLCVCMYCPKCVRHNPIQENRMPSRFGERQKMKDLI